MGEKPLVRSCRAPCSKWALCFGTIIRLHFREMTLASVESGLKGARMEAEKSEVFGYWLGRPADTFSQHWRLLAYAWPAPCLPGISLPAPPRGPRGRPGKRGVGWPCLGGLLPRPHPRRRRLAADPAARLRVICGPLSQWEGVVPARSLFLEPRTPPPHCVPHL